MGSSTPCLAIASRSTCEEREEEKKNHNQQPRKTVHRRDILDGSHRHTSQKARKMRRSDRKGKDGIYRIHGTYLSCVQLLPSTKNTTNTYFSCLHAPPPLPPRFDISTRTSADGRSFCISAADGILPIPPDRKIFHMSPLLLSVAPGAQGLSYLTCFMPNRLRVSVCRSSFLCSVRQEGCIKSIWGLRLSIRWGTLRQRKPQQELRCETSASA